MMLDVVDHKILAHLQANGRLTSQQLAEDIGMSSSACWRRVKSLEESGIIRGYAALVDRRKAGFSISAIVHVVLARHETMDVEPFEERLRVRLINRTTRRQSLPPERLIIICVSSPATSTPITSS